MEDQADEKEQNQQVKQINDEEKPNRIKDYKKGNEVYYKFELKMGVDLENKLMVHDLIGLPKIPIIGKYGRNGYEFNEVVALCAIQLNVDQKEQKFQTDYGEEIQIPVEIKDLLFKIPKQIQENNSNQNNNNNKNQNYNQKKNLEYNPFEYKLEEKIQMNFSISVQNPLIENTNKNNFMNLVLHPLIFEIINFETIKRIVAHVPVGIITPKDIQKSCSVDQWQLDDKFVQFDKLRSEYMSTHLNKGSLCLSPNNMKIEVFEDGFLINHFWSVVLLENGNHQITYHWNFQNPTIIQQLNKIASQSENVSQLINQLSSVLSESHDAIKHAKKIFNLN